MRKRTFGPSLAAAAISSGVGTGVWKSVEEACKRAIKQTEKISPNKRMFAQYEPLYTTYRKLYPDLKDRFREIAALAC